MLTVEYVLYVNTLLHILLCKYFARAVKLFTAKVSVYQN
jgi:hypothetical protein